MMNCMTTASLSQTTLLRRALDVFLPPHALDFWVRHLHPTWSRGRLLARVVACRIEARGVVTLELKPNGHWQGHAAGQHVNVTAEVDGRRLSRSYSLSGVEHRPGCVSITVKHVGGGALSAYLCEQAQVGDVLQLGQAFGKMTWDPAPSGTWLFLSAGSGITPFMGLIKAMSESSWPVRVRLVHWAGQRAEVCFKQALDELAARDPRFSVQWVLTREEYLLPGEEAGRLSQDLLARVWPQGDQLGASTHVRACGPVGFVQAAREAVADAPDFMAEAFSPWRAPRADKAQGSKHVKVLLQRSARTLDVPTDQPLLEALRAQGVNPSSGCGMGICHTCVCTKHEGSVTDTLTGTRQDEPGLPIRLCVSRACSDLSLDL